MEEWLEKLDKPKMLPIAKREKGNDNVDIFYFEHKLSSQPGQFVMMWLPGINEKPFSIAYDLGDKFGLAIAKVGEFTKELFKMREGDRVGIRGPYGQGFWRDKGVQEVLMVGGGYGVAPLATLAEELARDGVKIHFINGARSKDLLLFQERLEQLKAKVYTTTDDGSFGEKGLVTDPLKKILEKEKIDLVYACGPELMEKTVFDLTQKHKIDTQISLERYMKCGFGVCGACAVDDTGQPTCKKGPVLDGKNLAKISEFGKYHRDGSGKRISYAP